MLLYHVNVGWPVVDEGAEMLVPATAVEPRGDHPVEGYRNLGPPGRDSSSRSSSTRSPPSPTGGAGGDRQSPAGLGAYEVFRRNQLPHHFVWRMLGEGTYVVGIEPCTNRTAGRLDARERAS